MRWYYKHSLKKGRKKLFIFIAIIFAITIFIYTYIESNIRPKIIAMSEIKVRLLATQAINDAVGKKIALNAFNNLVNIKTDNAGKITMVQANTVEMNRLAVETSIAIQKELEDIKTKDIRISIGNVLGSQIFADYGPEIKITIQPAGSVNVDFTTEFLEAGINQTRLKIYLTVNTKVQIIIPFAGEKIDVSTHIPVSETIIVGDVPESYINIPKDTSNDFLKIVPTKNPFKD